MRYVLIIPFLLISIIAWSQSDSVHQNIPLIAGKAERTDEFKNNTEKNKHTSINKPITINLNAPGDLQKNSKDTNSETNAEPSKWTDPLSIFTGLLVVVTGVLGWMAFMQVLTTRRQLRAFVFPNNLAPFWEHSETTGLYNWRFRPQWHNSGDTPTKNVTIYTDGALRDTPLPLGFDFNYPNQTGRTGLHPPKVTLSGGGWPPPSMPAITPQDILDVQQGRKHLYVWGWVRYHDVFPCTAQHITRFCWWITPIGNPMTFVPGSTNVNEQLGFPYIYHHEGNCSDDECN